MAYNVFFTGGFDVMQSIETTPFSIRVDIFKNGYSGDPKPIILTGTPVIHEWQDDDPFQPVKGSTCKIGIINDGSVSLNDFYSDEDNTFRVEVRRNETDEALFIGYVLQDDCRELQVDFMHEIFITASDNLGLLKDVSLLEASKRYGVNTTHYSIDLNTIVGNPNTICSFDPQMAVLQPGDTFTVLTGGLQGTWTVTAITIDPTYGYYINVLEDTSVYVASYTTNVDWVDPIIITGYINLLTVVRLCFLATQLELVSFNAIAKILPKDKDTERWLEDTYILGESFKTEDGWMSCYDVLESITKRFKASAFQAYGEWWIVRWGEMYMQSGPDINTMAMLGDKYNGDFVWINEISYTDYSFSLLQDDIETGLEKAIDRPIQYAREQFDYNLNGSQLLNADLNYTPEITNVYTIGTIDYKEYTLPYWTELASVTKGIRVGIDNTTNEEVERYLFFVGANTSLYSNNIEVGQGDIIKWTFDYCTENSEPGPVNNVFNIFINDGINPTLKINNDGSWKIAGGFTYSVPTGDNVQNWHTVEITSQGIPYNAILNLYISAVSSNNISYESRYRNMNFEIIKPNDNLKYAIGHVHKDSNNLTVKNKTDINISMDDSPRGSIKGCLFSYDSTGIVRNKTNAWIYNGLGVFDGKLGYLTTLEQMMINYTARSLYYGSILKIWFGSLDDIRFISNFFVFNMLNSGDNRRFVPGNLSIDYKHNRADITLHQITEYGETRDDVSNFYTFNYIYENG